VQEAREQYHLIADALRLEIDGEPAALGEAQELALVFRNLIDNAIKYSGAKVDVCVRAAADAEGGVRVEIEDRGVGIARQELRRIFQPFYRAGVESQRRVKGLGLGLFIVRFLVRRQGGNVEASSDGPGRGSRFVVRLRSAPAASLRPETAPPAPLAART
jgi:signal transduction histidine kinase